MASQAFLCLLTAILAGLIGSSTTAYQFYVGGRDGWGKNPSENYNQWAEKMRFQVNDTLFFRYKSGENSVLVVNRGDYESCNTKSPVEILDGGDSIFKFNRSGPFYFISGHGDYCQKGQKLIVVVLAVRGMSPPPSHSPPSPTSFPPHAPAPGGEGPSPAPVPPPPHKSAASGVSHRPSVLVIVLMSIALAKFGLF